MLARRLSLGLLLAGVLLAVTACRPKPPPAAADYDRDGWPDLLVTGWGRVALFRNVPVDPKDASKGRRFTDVSAKAGLDRGIDWATSAAWADLDGDGYPDLYVCQYVNWSWKNNPPCTYDGRTP